jgi:hypothetical protein
MNRVTTHLINLLRLDVVVDTAKTPQRKVQPVPVEAGIYKLAQVAG